MKSQTKSKLKKALAIVLAVIFAVGLALSVYATVVQFAPVAIKIDASKTYQTMQGFGASACWTFQDLGTDEAATERTADLLYGDDGMKLEVIRYNIGAGTKEIDHGYVAPNRATESFFISENYTSKQSFSDPDNYDINRDKYAMRVLDACLSRGNIRTVVLFANSPHYLLTANGKGKGNKAYENNLPEENYEAFSDYMIIIADLFAGKLSQLENPPCIYVSPVNEPQWKWGGKDVDQEGCHYDPENLAKFYDVFYKKLKQYNSTHEVEILPDFFDCGSYLPKSKYKKYISEFKKYPFYDELTTLSFHSYGADNGTFYRNQFASYYKKNVQDKALFMSEYCVMKAGTSSGIDMGLYSAGVMMKDLTILSAAQWCWWIGVSCYGFEDGLLYYDNESTKYELSYTKRYSTFSQFTRYVSSGDVRIYAAAKGDPLNFNGIEMCAFMNPSGQITLVIINNRNFSRTVKLSNAYSVNKVIYTDKKHDLYEAEASDKLSVSAKSVTTVILNPKTAS